MGDEDEEPVEEMDEPEATEDEGAGLEDDPFSDFN
jgi:hypothetical protein